MLYVGNGRVAFLSYCFNTAFSHGVFIGSIDRVVVRLVQSDIVAVNKPCRNEANPECRKGNEKRRHKYRAGILPNLLFEQIVKDNVLVICSVIVLFQNIPNGCTLNNQQVTAPNRSRQANKSEQGIEDASHILQSEKCNDPGRDEQCTENQQKQISAFGRFIFIRSLNDFQNINFFDVSAVHHPQDKPSQ